MPPLIRSSSGPRGTDRALAARMTTTWPTTACRQQASASVLRTTWPPTMRPPDLVSAPRTRRRDKLDPDPAIRREILTAASKTLREQGVRGLSIAAVLQRAGLSTRAFYRHFDSKDELVAAAFLEAARGEMRR